MFVGKNGEYSLTRDVDEAFTRALAEVSKPFVVDSKDDGLTQFQTQSRLPDTVVALNDEELMKHLASMLFCRSTSSPMYELAESIGELSGGLVSNDMRGTAQGLPTSSPWGVASIDDDGVTAVTSDTKLTYSGVEAACIPNGIVDHTHTSSLSLTSSVAGVSSSYLLPSSPLTHLAVASSVTATRQSVPVSSSSSSSSSCTVAWSFSCMSAQRMSEASSVLSVPGDAATSSLDSLLAPVMTAPLLHIASLSALPQVLVSSPGPLPSSRLPSVQTLPDVQTLMKPSRQYIVDSRPVVTSGLSALPLASIFTPFSTAFCPPPPVSSSSVIKMDHPLAAATVLATVSVGSCNTSTVCSSALSNSAVSSVLPPVSVVQFTAGPAVLVPSSLCSSSAISHSGT